MLLSPLIARHPKLGRWIYAAVSALGAGIFCLVLLHGFSSPDHSALESSQLFIFTAMGAAFISGLICWPRMGRGIGRMIFAGLITVAISFLIFGLLMALSDIFPHKVKLSEIAKIPAVALVVLLFGSVFTLGIPYVVGIGLSFLFIDVDQALGDTNN